MKKSMFFTTLFGIIGLNIVFALVQFELQDADLVSEYPDGQRLYRYYLPNGEAKYAMLSPKEVAILEGKPVPVHPEAAFIDVGKPQSEVEITDAVIKVESQLNVEPQISRAANAIAPAVYVVRSRRPVIY